MKTTGFTFFNLLKYAALFAALQVAAMAARPGTAIVGQVQGEVTYTDATGSGVLKVGDKLGQGATITTGAESFVDLDLGVNGNALRVEADSKVALTNLEFSRTSGKATVNTQLDVHQGSVVANVTDKLSSESRYIINTPAGAARIQGTVLRAGATRIVCLIGRISFVPVAGGGVQLMINGGAGFSTGSSNAVKATSVETTGLARTACSLTANTMANMVTQAVQQFTAAIAALAAEEAAKTGGDAAAEAAAVAKTVLAQLIQEVQTAAAAAPPQVRAAVQQAVASVQNNSESIGATAAASGAAAGVVANGGTAQEAKTAATQAAQAASTNQTVATAAANKVTTGAINAAIQARSQGGSVSPAEALVVNTQPATGTGTTGGGTKTGVDTKIGDTTILVSDPSVRSGSG